MHGMLTLISRLTLKGKIHALNNDSSGVRTGGATAPPIILK